jgi:hypothetical protein
MMQTDVRPENAPASALPAVAEKPCVAAGLFRELVTIAKQVVSDDAVAAKQLAALERLRQIEAMSLEHLDKQVWVKLLDRAQAVAAQGESSFELIRFPCDLCSDGSRFRLRAQIVEYLDGIPNSIALSPSWAAAESSEMKQGH